MLEKNIEKTEKAFLAMADGSLKPIVVVTKSDGSKVILEDK